MIMISITYLHYHLFDVVLESWLHNVCFSCYEGKGKTIRLLILILYKCLAAFTAETMRIVGRKYNTTIFCRVKLCQ